VSVFDHIALALYFFYIKGSWQSPSSSNKVTRNEKMAKKHFWKMLKSEKNAKIWKTLKFKKMLKSIKKLSLKTELNAKYKSESH